MPGDRRPPRGRGRGGPQPLAKHAAAGRLRTAGLAPPHPPGGGPRGSPPLPEAGRSTSWAGLVVATFATTTAKYGRKIAPAAKTRIHHPCAKSSAKMHATRMPIMTVYLIMRERRSSSTTSRSVGAP